MGKLKYALELMDAKQLSRNALARSINARFEVIDKWYNGHVEKIDADILARICYVRTAPLVTLLNMLNKRDSHKNLIFNDFQTGLFCLSPSVFLFSIYIILPMQQERTPLSQFLIFSIAFF